MSIHIASSTSIGYYDRQTYKRLGGLRLSGYPTRVSVRVLDSRQTGIVNLSVVLAQRITTSQALSAQSLGQTYLEDGCYRDSRPVAVQMAQFIGSTGFTPMQSFIDTGIVIQPATGRALSDQYLSSLVCDWTVYIDLNIVTTGTTTMFVTHILFPVPMILLYLEQSLTSQLPYKR
jgi:hypothetical protein